MLLGKVTDTQDTTGTVLEEHPVEVTEEQVKEAVLSFTGEYMQVPPMYSALKVNGKKLCDLARAGVTVERQARPVQIYSIEIIKGIAPGSVCVCAAQRELISVHYVRISVRNFPVEHVWNPCCAQRYLNFVYRMRLRLSEIEERVQKAAGQTPSEQWNAEMFDFIYAVDSVFLQYKKAVICKEWNKLLYNGNRMKKDMFVSYQKDWEQQKVRIYDEEGRFIGIYEYSEIHGDYKPVKLFMEA